jgi:hypothetical protein
MTSSEPRNPVTLNSTFTRSHGNAREYCVQELNSEDPDYQAAQVYATLSVEEALRDLATAIGRAAERLAALV